jgi:AcrR family transcriptional regulator
LQSVHLCRTLVAVTTAGLRERKKEATRSALHLAALRLAVERGVENVTAEEIAAVAGVSTRTFFNYFATKEEAFVADDLERGRRFVDAVASAPDGEPLWPLLHRTAVVVFVADGVATREQALKQQLVRQSPAVGAHVLATMATLEERLVAELDRRTGGAPPLRARLLSNVVVAALRAAAETWLAQDGDGLDFPDLLDDAFTALAPAFRD